MMLMKVLAMLGTYHAGGNLERLTDAVLGGAREVGAETEKHLLRDYTIAFCRNCRACWSDPEARLGKCVIEDDMAGLLQKIADSDVLILGSPINYGFATALTKKFIERLGPMVYVKGRIPVLNQLPHQRILRDKGPQKGAALLTCFTPSIISFPLGVIRMAVKELKAGLWVTGHTDTEVFVAGGMFFGGIARRKRLLNKAKDFGRSLVV